MLLTKSKYLNGLQCKRLLWLVFNDPGNMPKVGESQQHIFDQGTRVGELAKTLYPDGINIETSNFSENLKKTKELILKKTPLFEAGFLVDELYSRLDILNPVDNGYDIIEVKSSTEVKDVNIEDVAFQRYCCEKSGLKINKCYLMHINNQYVRQGDIDPRQLFILEDITTQTNESIKEVPARVKSMAEIISSKTSPACTISPKCTTPYDCPLIDSCWENIPENSVFVLYRGGKKSFELYESGIVKLKDIPDEYKLTNNQKIQKDCEKTGKAYVDKDEIKKFLDVLEYPLNYLDFETYNTAIPLYDGLKPYQQIPFQFSLHIVSKKGEKPKHYDFLADGNDDPRPKFLKALKEKLGDKGTIVAYNQSFEISRLKELAIAFPEYAPWVESILPRFIDLLVPFQKFYYYNPNQEGSASIKKVLPALIGKSYEGMEISNGGEASLRYLWITHGSIKGEKATPIEVKEVRDNLLKYCELDTEAMILIKEELEKILK